MRRKRNHIDKKKKNGFHFLDLLEDDDWDAPEEDEAYYEDDDVYYAEDEAAYESEEVYEDDDVYYAEDEAAYEAEEYADDDAYYAEDEAYYESEAYAEDDDTYYADDEEYYESEEEAYAPLPVKNTTGRNKNRSGRPSASGKRRRKHTKKQENKVAAALAAFAAKIYSMPVADKVLMGTGAAVLAIAIVTCSVYASVKSIDAQVASFAETGEQLAGIGIVGESGLMALTNAELAMMNAVEEEPEEEEPEEAPEFSIGINMTSVEKDLKIKFVDTNTGKLISDIPFEVKVKNASGKSDVWTDDNKDGIIYHKDLTPGRYEVSLVQIEELKEYTFSDKALGVTVKDKIEYKQIDVADEIKSESEVNAAVEDTAEEVVTEEVLKDTVEWVESTRTEIGEGDGVSYEEIKKSSIPDPTASARAFVMQPFSAVEPENPETDEKDPEKAVITGVTISGPTEVMVGNTISLAAAVEGSGSYSDKVSWSSSDTSVATVKGGTVTGILAGTATIKVTTENADVYASVEIKVTEKPAEAEITSVIIDGASEVTVGSTTELTAKVEGTGKFSKEVTWSSSNESIATVKGGTVTGIAAGTVVIKAVTANDSVFTTKEITVRDKPATVTKVVVSGTKSIEIGQTVTLSAVVEGVNNPSPEVTWSSADSSIAAVTGKGEVTGIATGKVKITAVSKADTAVSGSMEITVTKTAEKVTIQIPEKLKLYTDKTDELKAKVTGSAGEITWESSKPKIVSVDASGDKVTVKGLKAGSANITAYYGDAKAVCKVTVVQNPEGDTTTILKDKDGNVLYIKDSKGNYVKATVADYFTAKAFYKQIKNVKYKYTGWQTIDGKTYYFDKNGNPVTGEQIILGARYVFASDGSIVKGSGTMGIDVSKWNGNINWSAVKNSGVSYVIIRCGYRGSSTGALIEDPMFKKNIQGASAAGLKIGIYFFTQAVTEVEAVEEASMTINLIKKYGISYPVFIDVEGSGGRADGLSRDARTNIVNAYCRTIQNAGYKAGIYANKTWLESKMNMGILNSYKIWLAQYNAQYTYKGKVDLWQYSSSGSINGINGRVDMNISYLGY